MAPRLKLSGALGHAPADRRIELLRGVGGGGSISQAARDAGVSYKAAWQAIDTLSNLAGAPLVEKAVGGAGGGGARLTPAGRELLRAADAMLRSRTQVMRTLGRTGRAPAAVGALSLRTSMRNQLPCTVGAIEVSGHIVTVELVLSAGQSLASRITRESAQLLALETGQQVLALCKATAVTVARDEGKPPGRAAKANVLLARATRVSRGQRNDEVAAELPGGLQVVGFAPPSSGLRMRSPVLVTVEASSVVIALPG